MIVQRRFLNSHEDAKVVSGNSSEKIIRISTVFITFFYFITVKQMLQQKKPMVALEEDTGRALH